MKYYFIYVHDVDLKDYGYLIDTIDGINICNEEEFNFRKSKIESYAEIVKSLPTQLFETDILYLDDAPSVYLSSDDILEFISPKYYHEISESTYNELYSICKYDDTAEDYCEDGEVLNKSEQEYKIAQNTHKKMVGIVLDNRVDSLLFDMELDLVVRYDEYLKYNIERT